MDMSVDREEVRRLRLDKSWSQEKLAEEAGLSLRTVQRIEADGVASLQSCRAIARALGVQPADLRLAADYTAALEQGATSEPLRVEQSARPVVMASPWRFVLLRTGQVLAISVLWLLMAFVAVNAFIVLVGGIFFWEHAEIPDLTAPQAAGGGILTAAVLALFFVGLRVVYRMVKRTRIRRAPEAAVE
jgi:transcriptional regulator with XRE-family HTH domain